MLTRNKFRKITRQTNDDIRLQGEEDKTKPVRFIKNKIVPEYDILYRTVVKRNKISLKKVYPEPFFTRSKNGYLSVTYIRSNEILEYIGKSNGTWY
jgi:hypothetical protein